MRAKAAVRRESGGLLKKQLHKTTLPAHNTSKGGCFFMKNFGGYVIIMLLFFIAAMAFMEVDRRCSDMYGTGGRIV